MNKNLILFEKIKKIEITYPSKKNFVFYNEILDQIKVKINDIEIDISSFKFNSRYHKQIRFENLLFSWLEKMNYISGFKEEENSILPTDTFCSKNNIEFKRTYN
jgi:hypothetical protein